MTTSPSVNRNGQMTIWKKTSLVWEIYMLRTKLGLSDSHENYIFKQTFNKLTVGDPFQLVSLPGYPFLVLQKSHEIKLIIRGLLG